MDEKVYQKARKEGLRAYSQAVQNNKEPYLHTLEEKVENLNQLDRVSLGVMTIHVEDIEGTGSQGRSYAFADNFMPILETGTEFATKWGILYESVEDEGVHEAIKVLEYLGKYYTVEGNKRVSVSKCLDIDYIEADVTRVMPVMTEEPAIKAYYEYAAFSKKNGLYDIVFTVPGEYQILGELTGNKNRDKWDEDSVRNLRNLFRLFRGTYSTMMKDRKAMQPGDAFMRFLRAFGFDQLNGETSDKIREKALLMKSEFLVKDEVNLMMDSKTASAPGLLASLFRPGKIKAAFLYTSATGESGWNYWHDMGRLEAEARLKDRLETTTRIVPSRTETAQAIDELIKEGYTLIFATSPVMLNSCIKPSLEHPEVKIFCNSMLTSYSHVRTYYLRFYEAKFLLGLAAGILAQNGKIGYITDFPVVGAPAAINAFAIGARMVNPEAKVYLEWSATKMFNGVDPFVDPEIHVICNRDITAPNRDSNEYGLYIRNKGEIRNMAMLLPKWGSFYTNIIERALNGDQDNTDNRGAMNYWWGLSSDALDTLFSKRFDLHSRRLINHFKSAMAQFDFTPFEGELRDQNGVLRCSGDRRLDPGEILCMDYLLDNVVGSFPELEELQEEVHPLVKLQGLQGELKLSQASMNWKKM